MYFPSQYSHADNFIVTKLILLLVTAGTKSRHFVLKANKLLPFAL